MAKQKTDKKKQATVVKKLKPARAKPLTKGKKAQKPPAEARLVKAELVDTHEEDATPLAGIETPSTESSEELDHDLEDSHSDPSRLPAPISDRSVVTTKDPIAVYLQEIRKYPVLSREEEQVLAKKYFETKDPAAAQALVTANLRFVVKIAAEYSKFGARLIDLVQEGNMGLMHAVRDFNPYKNVRLITYAVWWIRGYIQEYLMKQYSLVKIGTTQNQKKLFYRLQKEKNALDSLGETPDLATIGNRMGIPEAEVQEMANRLSGRDVSLNVQTDGDSNSTLMEFQKSDAPRPDESLMQAEQIDLLRDRIEKLRPQLSEREKILLDERILADDPLTLQELGEKHGITREAVRQMESRLLEKIKRSFESTS